MRITDGTEICQVCGKVPSIIYCDSCEKPLCRSCRKFDMWQQGCGSIPTKVFCVACATNPWVNPGAALLIRVQGSGSRVQFYKILFLHTLYPVPFTLYPALFVPFEDLVHEVLEGAGYLLPGKGDDLVDDLAGRLVAGARNLHDLLQ